MLKPLAFLLLAFLCTGCQSPTWDCLESARPRIEKSLNTEGTVRSVRISGNIDIELRQGTNTETVLLQGGKAVMPSIKTHFQDGHLQIEATNSCDWVRKDWRKPKAIVQAGRSLRIESTALGNLNSQDTLVLDSLWLVHDGQGDVDLLLKAEYLALTNDELANFHIAGKCDWLTYRSNNYGKLLAHNLVADTAELLLAGIGHKWLQVTDSLYVYNSGMSDVHYRGNPKTSFELLGEGKAMKW